MCELYFDEPFDVLRETERTARKAHRCTCCRRIIAVGEKYVDHYSVGDGTTSSGKLCADCLKARAAFASAHDNILATPDGLESLLSDCISDGDDDSERLWQPALDRIHKSREYAEARR